MERPPGSANSPRGCELRPREVDRYPRVAVMRKGRVRAAATETPSCWLARVVKSTAPVMAGLRSRRSVIASIGPVRGYTASTTISKSNLTLTFESTVKVSLVEAPTATFVKSSVESNFPPFMKLSTTLARAVCVASLSLNLTSVWTLIDVLALPVLLISTPGNANDANALPLIPV
ncbi:hypothetical protein BC829DRAFT_169046 [Chytridium lagenaria]|nr:hypothetical protein BC829DRAFT_169046 [Chytridium lagenaria]